MPTRVEKLQKRKLNVRFNADEKINRQKYGGRTAKVARKRVARIDKKIVKTKARVAKRATKKAANVLKRARKASVAYKSVMANPKSTKGRVKRATNKLNRLGEKAGGNKVMYPSMSYMDTFPKKK